MAACLGGVVLALFALPTWTEVLVTGRGPSGVVRVQARILDWVGQTLAWCLLLSDARPPLMPTGPLPVVPMTTVGRRRGILSICSTPVCLVGAAIILGAAGVLSMLTWAAVTVTGRTPHSLFLAEAAGLRLSVALVGCCLTLTPWPTTA
ncbi:MAG: hypothetical protein ACRD0J_06735, partial [Acidimicrobiales bacterium]